MPPKWDADAAEFEARAAFLRVEEAADRALRHVLKVDRRGRKQGIALADRKYD